MPDQADLMRQLTASLARLQPQEPLPMRLCRAFTHVVGARAGSVSVGFATTDRTVLCATDERAARFEDAQDMVREGPSLDAFRLGDVVTSVDLQEYAARWPQLARIATDLDGGQIVAVPMRPQRTTVGVMTIHARHDGPLLRTVPELQFLTDAIGTAIADDLPSPLETSPEWTDGDRISQAVGMVVAQLGVPAGDALAVLRAHAFAHEVSLIRVSRSVVARELDFFAQGGDSHD